MVSRSVKMEMNSRYGAIAYENTKLDRDILFFHKIIIVGMVEYIDGIKRQGSGYEKMLVMYCEHGMKNNVEIITELKKQFEEDPQRMKAEVEAEILRRM